MSIHPGLPWLDRLDIDSFLSFRWGTGGDDLLVGGRGTDLLIGRAGNDTLSGGQGNDYLNGGDGNDRLLGGQGRDILVTGAGNDVADGGQGNDLLIGGAGATILAGGQGQDLIFTGAGTSIALGGQGQDKLIGGAGTNALFGGQGNDVLLGFAGTDLVVGGAGNDWLDTGTGLGAHVGGAGRDTFRIGDEILFNHEVDRILAVDFNAAEDRLLLGQGILAGLGDATIKDITVSKALILQQVTDTGLLDPALGGLLGGVSDGAALERDLVALLAAAPDSIAAVQVTLGTGDQIVALGVTAAQLGDLLG
jgi:Ca2+-binding RTX toxin-like protein